LRTDFTGPAQRIALSDARTTRETVTLPVLAIWAWKLVPGWPDEPLNWVPCMVLSPPGAVPKTVS
jgi:hypothetical protein